MNARIVVGQGSCGLAAGAGAVYTALESKLTADVKASLGITGCVGICYLEPIVDVYAPNGELHRCVQVKPEHAEIIVKAVAEDNYDLLKPIVISEDDAQFLSKQTRIALRHCGIINPDEIDAYTADDGYKALEKVLKTMTPEAVIEEIKVSGLGGRGGAGFPTWFKWNAARQSPGEEKYLICNADEGDPGAFMDRAVIESDPHNLIEGMLIGAYAIGAKEAVVYVRAEYPLAIARLTNAIKQAEEKGYLGNNIMGTENSKGTKVFAVTGKVKRSGLVEIPMGMTLREVIFDIAGGIRDGKEFKAVQMGGPSGGCIPAHLLDTIIDYRALGATGAIMGSGGMVVMDETTCMVGIAKFFLDFTTKESCGKCVHCRIGTKRLSEILERIVNGQGKDGDIELLEELCTSIKDGALCGLGQTAPNPVLTTIRYFRNEYEDHIYNKKCTAKQCPALLTYSIDAEKCIGCSLCAKKCPVGAITGELKKTFAIDPNVCIRCGACINSCRKGAVVVE